MEQKKENFNEMLKFGIEGEKEVATILIKKGINVLPLYQFEPETSPKIINKEDNFISPDLTCFKDGKCFFVEVKNKKRWTINPINNLIETGCDYRLYKHYLELSKHTGIKLYLVFNHINNEPFKNLNESSSGYFVIDILEKGRYWDGINENTKVKIHNATYFWNYNQLKKLNNG